MKFLKFFGLAVLSVATLTGCQTLKEADNMAALKVDTHWKMSDKCSTSSPSFTVDNVPAGTHSLMFQMVDLDVPTYNHGGGTVEFKGGNDIPAGLFAYKGPCPPAGSHNYEWTVKAVNKAGDTLLGKGKQAKLFPPK